jgi:hypothetical protein
VRFALKCFCDFATEAAEVCEKHGMSRAMAMIGALSGMKDTMVKLVTNLSERMESSSLAAQPFFTAVLADGTALLPDPSRPQCNSAFWTSCADWVVPMDLFHTLEALNDNLNNEEVRANFVTANKTHWKSMLQWRVATVLKLIPTIGQIDDVPQATNSLQLISDALADVLDAESTVYQDDSRYFTVDERRNYAEFIKVNAIDTFFSAISTFLQTLTSSALKAMPDSCESLISQKNVAQIKKQMFDKGIHQTIVKELDTMLKLLKLFSKITRLAAEKNLCAATVIAKAAHLEKEIKTIQVYSSTVHGLNLVLNRMPGRVQKEKAAFLREQLRFS